MPHHNQRYAFVTARALDPRRGGPVDAALSELLAALNRRGKRIALVSPPHLPLPVLTSRRWFNLHVRRVLAGLDVDCVVGVGADGHRFAARPRTHRYVALLYSVQADEIAGRAGHGPRRLAAEARWEAQAARAADLVITPSRYARQRAVDLYQLPPERVAVLPCPIDLDRWCFQSPPSAAPPRVLCASDLTHRSGIDTLLNAWPGIRARYAEATLHIVGNGPLKPDLQQRARALHGSGTPVQFKAAQPTRELIREYAASDVACLACRQEAVGRRVLEAMATGRPLVATRVGAVPEIVGDTGTLVPPDDPHALADALLMLLDAPDLRKQKAAQAVARVSGFAATTVAARFGELLADL